MKGKAIAVSCLVVFGIALWYAMVPQGSAQESEGPGTGALCIRPGDVTPTPGGATMTTGLQDELLVDHTGADTPGGPYTDTRRVKIIRQTYAVGGKHFPHQHERAEQVYYLLKGRARVRVGNEVFEIGPGTAIYIPPKTEHELVNIGDTPVVNLLIDITLDEDDVD